VNEFVATLPGPEQVAGVNQVADDHGEVAVVPMLPQILAVDDVA
jgi:hypothetical protein